MSRPIRILVVDDSVIDTELTVRTLRRNLVSNPLETAATGPEALARLGDRSAPPIDLVLMDYRLPGMSGGELLAAIKADPALGDVRVIVLTTLAPADRRFDEGAQPDGVLEKPIELPVLLRALRRLGGYEAIISRDDGR